MNWLLTADTIGSGAVLNSILTSTRLVNAFPSVPAIDVTVESLTINGVPYPTASAYQVSAFSGTRSATFAAAVISGFGSIGPVVQEVIIPRVYDQKAAQASGELGPVFALLFGSAVLGTVFCAILVWRNRGGRGV